MSPTEVVIDLTARPEIPDDSRSLTVAAQDLQVVDQETYEYAAEIIQTCAQRIKTVEDPNNKISKARDSAYKAHKSIVGVISDLTKPYLNIRNLLTDKMRSWKMAEERKRQEADRQAQMAADAERKRIEDEAKAARRDGEISKARELVAQAAEVAVELQEPAAPKVEGITEKRPWVGECTDVFALAVAIVAGEFNLMHMIPMRGGGVDTVPILMVNPAVIAHYAKALGGDAKIPGVEFKKDWGISVGGRR